MKDVEESSLLVEQDWGMFEGTGLVKGKILYEKEYEHLQVQPSVSWCSIPYDARH